MTVSGTFDAFKKEIKIWNLETIKEFVNLENLGLKGSPTKVKKAFPKKGKGDGVLLKDLSADEAAQVIVNKLQ